MTDQTKLEIVEKPAKSKSVKKTLKKSNSKKLQKTSSKKLKKSSSKTLKKSSSKKLKKSSSKKLSSKKLTKSKKNLDGEKKKKPVTSSSSNKVGKTTKASKKVELKKTLRKLKVRVAKKKLELKALKQKKANLENIPNEIGVKALDTEEQEKVAALNVLEEEKTMLEDALGKAMANIVQFESKMTEEKDKDVVGFEKKIEVLEEDLKKEKDKLYNVVEEKQEQIFELDARIKTQMAEIKHLQRSNQASQEQTLLLSSEKVNADEKLAQLQSTIQDKQKQINDLQELIEQKHGIDLKEASRLGNVMVEELEAKIKDLEASLTTQAKNYSMIEEEHSTAKATLFDKMKEIEELEAKIGQLEGSVSHYEKLLSDALAVVDNLKAEQVETNDKLKELQASFESQSNSLTDKESQISVLEEKVTAADKQIDVLGVQIDSQKVAISKQEEMIASGKQERADLQVKLDQQIALHEEEQNKANASISEKGKEIKKLEVTIFKQETLIDSMKKERADIQDKLDRAEKMHEQMPKLFEFIKAEEEKNSKLEEQMNEKENIIAAKEIEVKNLEGEIATLSSVVKTKDFKIERLEDTLQERINYERSVIMGSRKRSSLFQSLAFN